MPVNTVNLILPGLFRAFHPPEITSDHKLSNQLLKLLARSTHLDQVSTNPFYDYQSNLPLARYECATSGIEIKSHQSVIYAQSLHLELKTDHIVARLLEITDEDITLLLQLLNDFYQSTDLRFVQVTSGKICCIFSNNQQVRFTPVSDVLNRDIKHFLPTGDDASYWKSLFNEIQMLLHENSDELAGALAGINALWFWGNIQPAVISEWPEYVAGKPGWIDGMCKLNHLNTVDINALDTIGADSVTVFDESFITAASTGDFNRWLEQLGIFEDQILEPLYNQLMNKVVDRILLYDSPTSAFELKRSDRFRLFRKTPTFTKICSMQ